MIAAMKMNATVIIVVKSESMVDPIIVNIIREHWLFQMLVDAGKKQ